VLLTAVGIAAGQNAHDADEPVPLKEREAGVQIGKAHVSFGGAIIDQDVLNIIHEHQAIAHAVHMWHGGLSGTYRSYQPTSPGKLLQEARQDSIAHFVNSLKGNKVRLQTFADHYSDAEVAQNPDLQHQLQSLLGLRARMRNALAVLRSGSPVIYAVEVEADDHHLETMATDARIFALNGSTFVGGKVVLERTRKPRAYENFSLDERGAPMEIQNRTK
jgi:hypothetical protein